MLTRRWRVLVAMAVLCGICATVAPMPAMAETVTSPLPEFAREAALWDEDATTTTTDGTGTVAFASGATASRRVLEGDARVTFNEEPTLVMPAAGGTSATPGRLLAGACLVAVSLAGISRQGRLVHR